MPLLANKIFQANREAYEAAENPLRSHGPDHHLRVYTYATKLATKLGVDYDDDVLAGATLLHDMAAYYPEQSGAKYHDFDGSFAKDILIKIGFPQDKLAATLLAISNHGSDPKYKNADEPIEIAILRDADKLDVFGPLGVARIVMVRTLKGDTLEDIVDDFYTNGHLQRKWDSITYDEARSLAKEDYEYSVRFFTELAKKLQEQPHLQH